MLRESQDAVRYFVILDDDEQRIVKMRVVLAESGLDIAVRHFDNAPDLLAAIPEILTGCVLISLDHDLGPIRIRDNERFDPGIGRTITEALAELAPVCQVIVHTSNAPAGQGMVNDLTFADWHVVRVFPHSDLEWIRADWLPAVAMALGRSC